MDLITSREALATLKAAGGRAGDLVAPDRALIAAAFGPADGAYLLLRWTTSLWGEPHALVQLGGVPLSPALDPRLHLLPLGARSLDDSPYRDGVDVFLALVRGEEVPLSWGPPRGRPHVTRISRGTLAGATLFLVRALRTAFPVWVQTEAYPLQTPYLPLLPEVGNGLHLRSHPGEPLLLAPPVPGERLWVAGAWGTLLGPEGDAWTVAVPLDGLDPAWVRPFRPQGGRAGLAAAIARRIPLETEGPLERLWAAHTEPYDLVDWRRGETVGQVPGEALEAGVATWADRSLPLVTPASGPLAARAEEAAREAWEKEAAP